MRPRLIQLFHFTKFFDEFCEINFNQKFTKELIHKKLIFWEISRIGYRWKLAFLLTMCCDKTPWNYILKASRSWQKQAIKSLVQQVIEHYKCNFATVVRHFSTTNYFQVSCKASWKVLDKLNMQMQIEFWQFFITRQEFLEPWAITKN